jgi:DNA polymerase-1
VHGRFFSDDPNLQNISNENKWWIYASEKEKREVRVKVRDGFIVPEGHWFVEFDYSQIEARLAAGVTGEAILLKAFHEGQDFHSKTASLMFGVPLSQVTDFQRRIGKTCNFALIYGGSAKTLYEELKADIPDINMSKAREYHSRYLDSYPTMFGKADLIRDQAERDGFVTTIFGRRIPIFDFQSSDEKIRSHGRRQAYNGVVSGSAADILKMSMVKLHKEYKKLGWLEKGLKMILTIHDSLVFDVPGTLDFAEFVRVTEETMYFKREGFPDVMASIAIGRRWGGLEKQGKKETVMQFAMRVVGGESSKAAATAKTFVLEIPDGAERSTEQLKRFTDYIQANPGGNTVEVRIGGDTIKLPWCTNVSITNKDKILLMMGGAFYEKTEKTSLVGVLE